MIGTLILILGVNVKTIHAQQISQDATVQIPIKEYFSVIAIDAGNGTAPANWLSIDIATFGGGIRYEHDLNKFFSVGVTIFFNGSLDFSYWRVGALATTRFFPGGFPFYIELGLGGGLAEGSEDERTYRITGFMVAPSVGARFDIGREGGFFINPFVSLSMVTGEKRWQEYPQGTDGVTVSPSFRIGIGLGWRF